VHQWSKRFGDANYQGVNSVAVDGSGNIILTGAFVGTVDFGGGPLTSGDIHYPDVFLAKFDAAGNHLWSRRFGNGFNLSPDAWVAGDGSGNVVFTGSFTGTVSLGGDPLTSAGSSDFFVAKFDDAGTHVWSKSFGDLEVQRPASVATDGSDNIVVAGRWGGDRPLIETFACNFVKKFDPDGNELWNSGLGCGDDARGDAVVDNMDNVVMTGTAGTLGIFSCKVTKLDASGNVIWLLSFGDYYNQAYASVATDGSGNVVLTGNFFGTVDFGGGPLTAVGYYDFFVAKFDADGNHLWSQQFEQDGDVGAGRAADDGSGNLVIAGVLSGTADFGGGPRTSAGSSDIFVAMFNSDGDHLSSRLIGDSEQQYGASVVADGSSNIVLTGSFYGTVDLGGGPLTSAGVDDIFVAKFAEGPLPVLITSFDATPRNGAVEVTWDLWSDEALESFALYRSDNSHAQTVEIAGGSFVGATRSYLDANVEPGQTYHYELLIHTRDGDDIRSSVATVTVPALKATLGQNFPNPFRPTTTIEYTMNERSSPALGIYDAAGRLIVRLDQGARNAGTHHAAWDGRDASGKVVRSGVYFYRLEGAPGVPAKKMVLLK
jgi:hypothetical protein